MRLSQCKALSKPLCIKSGAIQVNYYCQMTASTIRFEDSSIFENRITPEWLNQWQRKVDSCLGRYSCRKRLQQPYSPLLSTETSPEQCVKKTIFNSIPTEGPNEKPGVVVLRICGALCLPTLSLGLWHSADSRYTSRRGFPNLCLMANCH